MRKRASQVKNIGTPALDRLYLSQRTCLIVRKFFFNFYLPLHHSKCVTNNSLRFSLFCDSILNKCHLHAGSHICWLYVIKWCARCYFPRSLGDVWYHYRQGFLLKIHGWERAWCLQGPGWGSGGGGTEISQWHCWLWCHLKVVGSHWATFMCTHCWLH